jgi:molecular chaperone HscC
MGGDRSFDVGGTSLDAVELSACILDSLRVDAERALNKPVRNCVVTVPAYFNEAQRFATKRSAELAGMFVERVLNEPTAAAIAHGLHRAEEESRFLVFDLGGGTFDVCVMELFEGMLEVKSIAGESRLGGEDFTAALATLALRRAGLDPGVARADPDAWALLYKRAELLKRQLSQWPQGGVTLPPFASATQERDVEITAAEATAAWRPLIDRLMGPCRAALRGAGIAAGDLAQVILVGGATRMPCVRDLAREMFLREPLIDPEPDLLVARGAAVQAALCADDAAVSNLVVTDVASHSLGIDVVRQLGGQLTEGYFEPLIERNTVIPISRGKEFSTTGDGQTQIHLRVFEGEGRRVEENRLIGDLWVKKIPRGRAGEFPVQVTFTLDLDGILEVEAEILATKVKSAKIFQREGDALSEKRLERARERIRALKTDPALRPRHRDLLGRADLLWREVTGDARQLLELGLRAFEGALAGRDPDTISQAYDQLLGICSALDQGERW